MKKIGVLIYFLIVHYYSWSQDLEKPRLSFLFKAGRNILKPLSKDTLFVASKESNTLADGFKKSDFVQQHVGLMYHPGNNWGFGALYSFVLSPYYSINHQPFFSSSYPSYSLYSYQNNGPQVNDFFIHFFSAHVEHAFEKGRFFATPSLAAGIGWAQFGTFGALLKKPDANEFLYVGVSHRARPSFMALAGVDLGFRFIKDYCSIAASPSLGTYYIQWKQEHRITDIYGNQSTWSRATHTLQSQFIFMIRLDIRFPILQIKSWR